MTSPLIHAFEDFLGEQLEQVPQEEEPALSRLPLIARYRWKVTLVIRAGGTVHTDLPLRTALPAGHIDHGQEGL